jgi:glycosyltransferase involved in cell wall biosynthesis
MSGAELTLLDLLRALPTAIEPLVACPPGELRRALDGMGVPCARITGTTGSLRLHLAHSSRATAQTAASAVQLRAAASRFGADIVHANSIRASLIASAARTLRGPPVLSHLHDVLPAGRVGHAIARVLAMSSRVVLANSGYTAADFVLKAGGRGRGRVRVEIVNNPVDLERFDPARTDPGAVRAQLGLRATSRLVGVVGQITPWKAQSDAIRAFAVARQAHHDLQLVIAGAAKFVEAGTRYDNRDYDRSLRALAMGLGVGDDVRFCGEVKDVPGLMAALELALVPSWEEPFGRVVIEAMAMATPVLATNVGGPAEIISDEIDGLLLAPREPNLWGQRLTRVLSEPDRIVAMGSAARTTVAARYDLPSFTRSIVNCYELAMATAALP